MKSFPLFFLGFAMFFMTGCEAFKPGPDKVASVMTDVFSNEWKSKTYNGFKYYTLFQQEHGAENKSTYSFLITRASFDGVFTFKPDADYSKAELLRDFPSWYYQAGYECKIAMPVQLAEITMLNGKVCKTRYKDLNALNLIKKRYDTSIYREDFDGKTEAFYTGQNSISQKLGLQTFGKNKTYSFLPPPSDELIQKILEPRLAVGTN